MARSRRGEGLGLLLVAIVVACGRTADDDTSDRGGHGGARDSVASGAGAPPTAGVGDAGGRAEDPTAGGQQGLGGGAEAGAGGMESEGGGPTGPFSISVIGCDDSSYLVEVDPAVVRYCLLQQECLSTALPLGVCLWSSSTAFESFYQGPVPYSQLGACASALETCEDLSACMPAEQAVEECSEPGETTCVDNILHRCSADGVLATKDCGGLVCGYVEDVYPDYERSYGCFPQGCYLYDSGAGSSCSGDDLVTSSDYYGGDAMAVKGRMVLHCPDFGFATCSGGECVN